MGTASIDQLIGRRVDPVLESADCVDLSSDLERSRGDGD